MKRITDPNKEYKTKFLRKLQEYENIGWQPDEITPKPGSVADKRNNKQYDLIPKEKHKIILLKGTSHDGMKPKWSVIVDGEEMGVAKLGEMIGESGNTVRWWCSRGTFERNLRERGWI